MREADIEENIVIEGDDAFFDDDDEDDFLLDAMIEDSDANNVSKREEEIIFPPREVSLIDHVASLLSRGSYDSDDGRLSPPTRMVLGGLSPDVEMMDQSGLSSAVHHLSARNIAGFVYVNEATRRFVPAVEVNRNSTVSSQLREIGLEFGEIAGRNLGVEAPEVDVSFREMISTYMGDQKVETQILDDGKQDVYSVGLKPELKMAAAAVMRNLEGYEGAIPQVQTREQLAQLVFLNKARSVLDNKYVKELGLKSPPGIEGIADTTERTVIALAREFSDGFGEMTLEEATAAHARISSTTIGFSADVAKGLKVAESGIFSYQGTAAEIVRRVEEEFGIVIRQGDFGEAYYDSGFNEFIDNLRSLDVPLYQPDKQGVGKNIVRGSIVRLAKALNGDRYKHGETTDRYPLGSTGEVLSGEEVYIDEKGYNYFGLEELERLVLVPTKVEVEYRVGDDVKVVKNLGERRGYGKDGYFYSGKTSRLPLNTEGEVRGVFSGGNQITVRFPSVKWDCHPDELEFVSGQDAEKRIRERDEVRSRVGKLKEGIGKIIDEVNEERKASERKLSEFVGAASLGFASVGFDPEIVRVFFDEYLNDTSDLVEAGVLAKGTVFTRIIEAQDQLNYSKLADKIVSGIEEKMGVVIFPNKKVGNEQSYQEFKKGLADLVMNGFRKVADDGRERLQEGDKVFVTKTTEDYDGRRINAGAVGKYKSGCSDSGRRVHIDLSPKYRSTTCLKRGEVNKLQPAYDVPKTPKTEVEKGSRVKIRRDSRYARESKEVGTVLGDFVHRHNGELFASVRFDNGFQEKYRRSDLEFAEKPKELEGFALLEYRKKIMAAADLYDSIAEEVAPIVEKVEAGLEDAYKVRNNLTVKCIDTLRKMGFDDDKIEDLFSDNLNDTAYIGINKFFGEA